MSNLINENNQIFISSIIIAVLFFIFVMPAVESCYTQEKKKLKEKFDSIFEQVKNDNSSQNDDSSQQE
jgi:uncharacterized membrane protein YgaE (UPF0421/DUF939 family)